ncbi:MAG TPA: SusC/RagA family TonB-linked outer membrane protein [Gemmatimonadaceae bacterium]|nr:SusC/RagA family TonB-linked outer membrane protein [Gemmatimonadaceae bacterium]
MKHYFRGLFLGITALVSFTAWAGAQEGTTIQGRVTTEGGAPLAAVSVFVVDLNVGSLTRDDGTYTFAIPAARVQGQEVTLTARLIGYTAQSARVTLRPGTITQDFAMVANPLRLGEVVVTGAGTLTTAEKLGNVRNSVDSSLITKSNEANVVQALAAKAPNVEVTQQSGDPGASSYIRIRGSKTIQGTGQPLFVVDGTPIDNTTFATGPLTGSTVSPNRAGDINPADIESIEILKGSAAAAIYGARAAQGVVLITTKGGRVGPTRYSLRSSLSIDEVTQGPPLQRRFGQGSGGTAAVCSAPGCRPASVSYGAELPAGTPTYDHFNEMFETGWMLDNVVTASGGSDRTSFYFSAGRLDHDGTIVGPNSWYDRSSFRVKATHRLLDRLTIGGNVSYVDARGSFIQKGSNISGLMLGALRTPPEFDNRRYLDSTGLHRSYRYPRPTALAVTRGYDNPFFVVNEHTNVADAGRVFGNVNLDYDPTNWLSIRYTLGGDYTADERLEALPPSSSNWAPGSLTRGDIVNYQIDHNLIATGRWTYSTNLAGSVTLGHNLNSRRNKMIFVTGYDYIAPDVDNVDNTIDHDPFEDESYVHNESFFGQATFDFWDQLFLTAGVRNDGSSTFGKADRRHWFPKASAAWNFTEALGPEGLAGVVTTGKLRVAYGETGREPFAYQTIGGFSIANQTEGWGPFLSPTQKGGLTRAGAKSNDELKPERTTELEAGFDIGLFKEKADLSVTYYDSRSKDVIFQAPLPPTTGYTSQVQNAAIIDNTGWEATLNLRPFTRPNFAMETTLLFATNDNLVVDLSGFDYVDMAGSFTDPGGAAVKGSRVGVLRSADFARCRYDETNMVDGIDINASCRASNAPQGALYIAADGFPILDPTSRVIADPNPDWTGSVRTAITLFRKWQVSGLLDIKQGGDNWNGTKGALYNFGTHKDTEIRNTNQVFGRNGFHEGAVAGPGAGTAVLIDQDWFQGLGSGFGPVAAQFIEDASYVKLREISVAYTLDQAFLRRFGMSSVDLRVAGRNLKTWTDYTGIDPETNLGGAEVALRGIDYFNNPQTRSFVFSVGLNW